MLETTKDLIGVLLHLLRGRPVARIPTGGKTVQTPADWFSDCAIKAIRIEGSCSWCVTIV